MPKNPRNYEKEYKKYHGTPEHIKDRATRNKARDDKDLKKGDGKEVDHKKPLSRGGSNSKSNTRITTRSANRKKYDK